MTMSDRRRKGYKSGRNKRLDGLLRQIHESGIEALSTEEVAFLNRCAEETKVELEEEAKTSSRQKAVPTSDR